MASQEHSALEGLRERAERLLHKTRCVPELLSVLERIVRDAPRGSEHHGFAHHQLATLHLERHPWRAALHLRELVATEQADDCVHAMMGLCQALMGNYRAATSCYRKALECAPDNPWYLHNLGHILDVGLGEPDRAEPYLRDAHALEPDEHEVTASLAHCLARLGHLTEAEAFARQALAAAPESEDHQALNTWIRRGAPEHLAVRTLSVAP